MALIDDLMTRSGGLCELCGGTEGLAPVEVPPGDAAILLCATCREEEAAAPEAHWRCLEGAAWSVEPAVQVAVWRKLGLIDAPWAQEARDGMTLEGAVRDWAEAGQPQPGIEHRDCNGVALAQGDTVVLIKDLQVKGAGFTAKRGTAVRGISLVPDNAAQIEGRVEGQRIVILTEFVKRK
ncbi:PhnA protein [Rhodobacter veldkampii DSM 11550]|uniref:PhnA protein n=1 Tax=Phaeovulum veldkampii DSM 11550 TaxID=1185920 RepID=A0A2T4JKF2_9RHOB|nr:alkylphosphonate utilization protein [Phaeovulum veldkampii]MBK5946727.1 PhnA protein [Phaeovulum veldkampii DSM 11550]NCU20039.1 PhnA protein [Candidatus Falkowbacteria bacterium]PTE18391.1 PhnA protein [Phaeovulum veldkampii DSM 11550]TDQ59268.1 protein PhnA [Phaeovulum veldkampii DSM 11550]